MNTVAAICGVLKRFSGDTVRFRLDSTFGKLSVASQVEPPLKTCGNDVLSDDHVILQK